MSAVTGISHLCDSRIEFVYRPPTGADVLQDELQNVEETFIQIAAPAGLNCRANQKWSGDLQDHGPGEEQGAQRQWFLVKDFDVQERDILPVVSGPEAPLQLRVLSVTKLTSLKRLTVVHHIEVNVEMTNVTLTVADDYS